MTPFSLTGSCLVSWMQKAHHTHTHTHTHPCRSFTSKASYKSLFDLDQNILEPKSFWQTLQVLAVGFPRGPTPCGKGSPQPRLLHATVECIGLVSLTIEADTRTWISGWGAVGTMAKFMVFSSLKNSACFFVLILDDFGWFRTSPHEPIIQLLNIQISQSIIYIWRF